MTLEETNLSVEQLEEIRDRSLVDAYEVHDVGQEILEAKLEQLGFIVEPFGDDARHADEVLFGDGPDVAVYERVGDEVTVPDDREPLGYIEIKTKELASWFGHCNLRHFREYVNFSNEVSAPVFIWFALVDAETERLKRDAFVEVTDTDQIAGDVIDVSTQELVFYRDDIDPVTGTDNLCTLVGNDVIGISRQDTIVGYIPEVHGNEVIQLDDTDFLSWPGFQYRLDR